MSEKRTNDLYEELDGYPLPPLPIVADITNPESFARLGIEPGYFRYFAVKQALKFSGFLSFYRTLPTGLEPVLRKKICAFPDYTHRLYLLQLLCWMIPVKKISSNEALHYF